MYLCLKRQNIYKKANRATTDFMPESMPYADIIILALIAGFILLRLRSVLGRKDDEGMDFLRTSLKQVQEPVVQLPEKSKPKPKEETDTYLISLGDSPLAKTLIDIRAKDPLFSAAEFLRGAMLAYEMVFDAFIKGDKPALKMLMSDELYKHFASEIDARAKEENHSETTLVSVASKDIVQASLENSTARITVKFVSEQVTVVRDTKGNITSGDPSALHHAEDVWQFERDVAAKNPNWKIIET